MGYELNSRRLEELKNINQKLEQGTQTFELLNDRLDQRTAELVRLLGRVGHAALAMVIAAVILAVLLALLAWHFLGQVSTPHSVIQSVMVLPLASYGGEVTSAPLTLSCYRSERAFALGRFSHCAQPGGADHKCSWALEDFKRVSGNMLQEPLTENHFSGAVSAFVVAGHDKVRVRADGTLDSNFELASLRTAGVARQLEAISPPMSLVPIPMAHLPEACLPSDSLQRTSEMRRSPALLILSRSAEQ